MWSADFVSAACGARISGPVQQFASVSNDTRTIKQGALYVALRGENFDGHQFVDKAIAAGATGILASAPVVAPSHVTLFQVSDTLLALQHLGHAARKTFSGPLIAVTGSNGKTSTRQFIASVLRAHYGDAGVLATEGNFNNHIGVPLTLLRLTQEHRVAVIEMGMNHFHELSLLTGLAKPTIALITNAGPAHLEGVGSLAGVARAKAEIFDGMSSEGVAILNADDYFLSYWEVVNRNRRCIRFGFGDRANIRGSFESRTGELKFAYGAEGEYFVKVPFSGEHNGRNALAAVAVAQALGLPLQKVISGLESATNIGGRLTRRALGNGVTVIDDSYNANPASVLAGVQVLRNEPHSKVVVLGDMAELGVASDELHLQLLRDIEASDVDRVLTLGSRMQRAASALHGRTEAFAEMDTLVRRLIEHLAVPTTVLVKGAHSMAMHRIVDHLVALYGEKK
jgi:UDP-N-acetylmuramoyl-tripeptide--D-alanyl-D-alanine ligase